MFALLIRIAAVVLLSPQLDAQPSLSIDALAYHQLAQNLVERQMYTNTVDPPYDPQRPGTFRPPLTPFVLAGMYALCGVDLFWGRLGLAIISAISCGLTYWLGALLFGPTTGIVAGLLSCLYPLYLLLVLVPLTEGISLCLSLALLLMLVISSAQWPSRKNIGLGWIVGIGVLLGLAALNKSSNVVLVGCLGYWGLFQMPGAWWLRLARLVAIGGVAALVILPWTIRNYQVTGALLPVNSNGGWTFYLGNNPHTAINLSALENGTTNGWVPPAVVFESLRDIPFAATKQYEQRAVQLAWQFITREPGTALDFAWRKLKIFWRAYNHPLDQIAWYPLAVCAALGFLIARKAWRQQMLIYLLILASMLIPVCFTSMPRFRVPITPYLLMYAAFGIVTVWERLRQRQQAGT